MSRWVGGKWSVGRWVGGSVVGGFNKTSMPQDTITYGGIRFIASETRKFVNSFRVEWKLNFSQHHSIEDFLKGW